MKVDYPYVYADEDRHGTPRVYFRRHKGGKKVRIREAPGTDAFNAVYWQLRAEWDERPADVPVLNRTPIRGTFRWLCVEYFRSTAYADLSETTRNLRKRILEHCFQEPTEPGATTRIGDMPLTFFNGKAVRVLRDRKAGLPGAANDRLKAISPVFLWAMEEEIGGVAHNPVRDVKRAKAKGDGLHTWTLEEIEQFEARHPIGTKARLALALLLYLGQRRSDIPTLGRQHVRDGKITFTQFKNRERSPVRLEIPLRPELLQVIEASPCGDLTFLVTDFGKPFTIAGFGNKFREWCDEAGLKNCASHGLRKAAATRLAELGAPPHEIMAITGHKTLSEVQRYTKAADQKRLAQSAVDRHAQAKK